MTQETDQVAGTQAAGTGKPDDAIVAASTAEPASVSGTTSSLEQPNQSRAHASEGYKVPEFASMQETHGTNTAGNMDRFYDVHVPVWAELGRIEMPLGELMKLDEGAVLRLDRPVGEPVDLMSQGVKLARGEVVVIDDCFAIRIKEIEMSPKGSR